MFSYFKRRRAATQPPLLRYDSSAALGPDDRNVTQTCTDKSTCDTQWLTEQSLRLLLCSQDVPYFFRLYITTSGNTEEMMELGMEANPWDKGFFSTFA